MHTKDLLDGVRVTRNFNEFFQTQSSWLIKSFSSNLSKYLVGSIWNGFCLRPAVKNGENNSPPSRWNSENTDSSISVQTEVDIKDSYLLIMDFLSGRDKNSGGDLNKNGNFPRTRQKFKSAIRVERDRFLFLPLILHYKAPNVWIS